MERADCRAMVRAANRLWRVYQARRDDFDAMSMRGVTTALRQSLTEIEHAVRCRTHALERGWDAAHATSTARLQRTLEHLSRQAEAFACQSRDPRPRLPPIGELYEELLAARDEFGGIELEQADEIAVTTEPVWLRDICFGPFRIVLHLTEMRRVGPEHWCSLEALDPNPAAADEDVTHPHVSKGLLCAGEAAHPIRGALLAGRLSECFLLVRSVLRTYNPGSPYVRLSEWQGMSCSDCGCTTPDDCGCCCPGCEEFVCDDCLRSCAGCGDTRCRSCLTRSELSDDWACPDCESECERCGSRCVCSELENDLCPTCNKENDDEETAEDSQHEDVEETDASAPAGDRTDLLGAGVAQAPVPVPPR